MLCILVFIILVFITSTIVDIPNENDTCIVKEGDQFPSFINHGYGGTETVLCSMDTCLCDGSNTRYKGCQSCCCSRRERTEGNESITYEEIILCSSILIFLKSFVLKISKIILVALQKHVYWRNNLITLVDLKGFTLAYWEIIAGTMSGKFIKRLQLTSIFDPVFWHLLKTDFGIANRHLQKYSSPGALNYFLNFSEKYSTKGFF